MNRTRRSRVPIALLSIPAGIALLGLGLVTLWTTRRHHGGLLRRSLRRVAIGVGALVVFALVLFPLGYHLIDLVGQIAPRALLLIDAPDVDGGEERRFTTAF